MMALAELVRKANLALLSLAVSYLVRAELKALADGAMTT